MRIKIGNLQYSAKVPSLTEFQNLRRTDIVVANFGTPTAPQYRMTRPQKPAYWNEDHWELSTDIGPVDFGKLVVLD